MSQIGAYPSAALLPSGLGPWHLKGVPFGYALVLTTNIRLGWNGLPDKNTQAYCAPSSVSRKYVLNPWPLL